MKTITKFLLGLSALALTFHTQAGVNPTTAWFNGETFETYTLGQDLTAAGESAYSGWTKNAGFAMIQSGTTFDFSSTASGQFLGFTINNTTSLAEVAVSGGRYFYKTFPNALSGLVYGKMAFFTATGGSTYSPYYGTDYQLKDASGNIVFEFGGMAQTSNALWMTGVDRTTMALGARAKWADIEFVLDLSAKKIVKATITYNSVSKTFKEVALNFDSPIVQLYVHENRGYAAGAIDNATLGQLVAEAISAIQGETTLQTLSGETVSQNYSVDLTSSVMDTTLIVSDTSSDITWTVSDWGTLGTTDQGLVSLTRSAEDTKIATLAVGAISADATITLQAVFGSSTLTQQVLLKSVSVDGLKATLTEKANAGKDLVAGVTDDNPYISSEKTKLNTVITNSEALVASASSTVEDITLGLSNQETANSAFSSAIAPYTTFVSTIATVQATHDAEVRTAAFFTTIKASLQAAIDVAVAAKATVVDGDAIAAAQAAVVAAETQFKTDVPAFAELETQIATTGARLAIVTPRVGEYFLNYDATAVSSLTAAKTSADGVLVSATTATELISSKTTLVDALTAFNAVPRIASHTSEIYKIYTYGVDNGDGDTIKKVLNVVDGIDVVDTLKFAAIDNPLAVHTEWSIETNANGTYVMKNLGTLSYFNGLTLSETASEITLPENTSQNGLISAPNDEYFFYSIVTSSGKGLEVDVTDPVTGLGVFKTSSAPATRMRFAYQFEFVGFPTSNPTIATNALKAYSLENSLVVAGLERGQMFAIYNVSGMLVKSIHATSELMQFELPAGVYVVKSAEQVVKAIVK